MESADSNVLGQLILILILTMVNAFFAAAEISIVSVDKKKISLKANENNKKSTDAFRIDK